MLHHIGKVSLDFCDSVARQGLPPTTYFRIWHQEYPRPIGQIRFSYSEAYCKSPNMIRLEFDIFEPTLLSDISKIKEITESVIALSYAWLCIDNNYIYKSPIMCMTAHGYDLDSKKLGTFRAVIVSILNSMGAVAEDGDKYIFPSSSPKIISILKSAGK